MPVFNKEKLKRNQSPEKRKTISSKNYFPPKEDQMTQSEVAEMFGRTVQTIINWKKNNTIPYYQIGRHPIFSRKQLTDFASKNQNRIAD